MTPLLQGREDQRICIVGKLVVGAVYLSYFMQNVVRSLQEEALGGGYFSVSLLGSDFYC